MQVYKDSSVLIYNFKTTLQDYRVILMKRVWDFSWLCDTRCDPKGVSSGNEQ